MIAVSSTATAVEEQPADACSSDDDVALFEALKLKISSSPEKGESQFQFNRVICQVWFCRCVGMFE